MIIQSMLSGLEVMVHISTTFLSQFKILQLIFAHMSRMCSKLVVDVHLVCVVRRTNYNVGKCCCCCCENCFYFSSLCTSSCLPDWCLVVITVFCATTAYSFCLIIIIIIVGLAPVQCVAPLAANNLQSGLSRASSVASSTLRRWNDRLFFTVGNQEVWGRPDSVFQSLSETAVRILASADSSILAKWPNSIRRLFFNVYSMCFYFTFVADRTGTAWSMIGYWRHCIVCLSVCMWRCALWLYYWLQQK